MGSISFNFSKDMCFGLVQEALNVKRLLVNVAQKRVLNGIRRSEAQIYTILMVFRISARTIRVM